MNEHLINKAADWFDDKDKWFSFLELCNAKEGIARRWMDIATEKLRQHCQISPPGWSFVAWGCTRDTWWFLEEFGVESIGVGFGWDYRFCFGARGPMVNRDILKKKLKDAQYAPLHAAFGDVHERGPEGFEFVQDRGFAFGSPNDGHLPMSEFAWYAAHKMDSFIQQASAKIEAFTKNPEVERLMIQLNRETLPARR